MAKHIVLIILLSVGTIIFKTELSHVLDSVVYVHNQIAQALHLIFSDDNVGRLLQDIFALLLIPLVCGIVLGTVFWLIKRSQMPNMMAVVWVVWLVLLVTMIAQDGMVTTKMIH
jgi:hypothetical protein